MNKTAFLFLAFLWMLFPSKSFAQFEEEDNRIMKEFIVMLKPGNSMEQLLKEFPVIKIKESLSPRMNIHLVERNSNSSPDEFLLSLQRSEHVKLAQFNHRVEPRSVIPNDSYFSMQWNLLNTGQNGGIEGADIEATNAWDINTDNVTADGAHILQA
jgi:hypothetical protein